MNILISTNTNYIIPTVTMLYSLFSNNQGESFDVYLPYSNLSEGEVNALEHFVSSFKGCLLFPIDVGKEFENNVIPHDNVSIEAYYRILVIDLLPKDLDRILYLDVDIIIQKSLREFYQIDLQNYPFAVCEDIIGILNGFHNENKNRLGIPNEYSYFNSGVLLYNLRVLREEKIAQKLIENIYKNFIQYEYNDQDALNELLYDKVLYVPWDIYNLPPAIYYLDMEKLKQQNIHFATYEEIRNLKDSPQIFMARYQNVTSQLKESAKIIHYMGAAKPWNKERTQESYVFNEFDQVYFKYNLLAEEQFHSL